LNNELGSPEKKRLNVEQEDASEYEKESGTSPGKQDSLKLELEDQNVPADDVPKSKGKDGSPSSNEQAASVQDKKAEEKT